MSKSIVLRSQIGQGNADFYGFSSANYSIASALQQLGYNLSYVGDIELTHLGPHMYNRHPNRFSILWPPYEASAIAKVLVDKINEADLILASCQDNADVFLKGGVTKPIVVCRLGINTKLFHFMPRKHYKGQSNLFRFLWIGQADIRKGWDLLVEAFQEAFTPQEKVELYIKTTGKELQELYTISDRVWVDSRNLALADLLDLYHRSHVFVFPSRGEGTGLPALEAMATGCLVLAPPTFGLKDFITEETAVPLEYKWRTANYGIEIQASEVLVKDLAEKMRDVYENYSQYRTRMKQGRNFVEDHHSLKSMGVRLEEILSGIHINERRQYG